MKFKDIPKQFRQGNWECSYGFKSLVRYINELKEDVDGMGYKLQMNPDFQRGHVWTEEQQSRYIEAVLSNGARQARTIYLNCPDWSRINKKDYHEFVCMDGLQRYTAIEKFYNNQIKAYGHYLNEYEDKDILLREHFFKLNINDLDNRKDVLKWYLQINDGGTPHTKEEIERVKKLYKEELGK